MTYFVKDGQIRISRLHEIMNKIESRLTRAFIEVSKRAD